MGILGFHFLVNFVLLAIPIGITLGILFGIDAERSSNGQSPIYSPPASTGGSGSGSGSGGGGSDDLLTTKTYCDKSIGITPKIKGQEYTLNPNQWGWDSSEGGGLCMNVTTYDNSTYPTKTTAPAWSITWEYPAGPEDQPVHAYPNIKVEGDVFPATVESLAGIEIDFSWTYGMGNSSATTTDATIVTGNTVNANVALDTFFDSDEVSSKNSSLAAYEVMVWFAMFGLATQPIGYKNGTVTTETINGTTFGLYTGSNSLDQRVLTWVADTTADTFSGDLLPLITKLFTLPTSATAKYPVGTDYLGYMAFGSECYYSTEFTTFSVPSLSINVTSS